LIRAIWAHIFADPGLPAKYWTKLIRSCAAESLTSRWRQNSHATQKDAQLFLDAASYGRETSEGWAGLYPYSEMHAGDVTSFTLRVLLPGTDFDVHSSRVRMESGPSSTCFKERTWCKNLRNLGSSISPRANRSIHLKTNSIPSKSR
jgi:hypothetical protein